MLAAGYETAARRAPFTQAQIDLPISPAADLAAFLPRSRVDRGSVKRPAPHFYKRYLKAIAGEALRCATKISPKKQPSKTIMTTAKK
jgi:hypothetical protein